MMTMAWLRPLIIFCGINLALGLAACTSSGTPAAQTGASPTAAAAPAAPTSAATAVATAVATTAPTAAATPTSAPAATKPAAEATKPAVPTAGVAAATIAPTAAAAAAPAGGMRLTITPEGSEARYRAKEQLAGQNLPSDAVGSTKDVTGTIVLGANGGVVREGSKITIDLRTLKSDESRRDSWIQRSTLETARYPNAEFVPAEARGLPAPLPTSGEATFDLAGDLTVHGVTRPAVWKVNARFAPQEVTGTAMTTIKLEDFGMTPPRVGPVLSIEENLQLELDFRATRDGAAAAGFDLVLARG